MYFMDKLSLNEAAKLTNSTYPIKDYITSTQFPEQEVEMLLTRQWIYYRDRRHNTTVHVDPLHPDHRILHTRVLILRYDKVFPYIMIGMGEDTLNKGFIFIIKRDPNIPLFDKGNVAIVPEQNYNFYLDRTINYASDFDFTFNEEKYHNAIVIRCDEGEPSFAVTIESLDDTHQVRLTLADEVLTIQEEHAVIPVQPGEIYEHFVYDYITRLLEAGITIYGMEPGEYHEVISEAK